MHPTTGAAVTEQDAAVPVVERDTKRGTEGDQVNDVAGQAGLNDEWRRNLDQATYVGLSRTRHQMLGDHAEGALEKVEVERRLLAETTKGFKRAVADARAAA